MFQNVLTPWVHIHHKYLQKLQVLWIRYCCTSLWCTCPKIAFFHRFWLKGHEELLSTIKLERLETCVWQENTCAGVSTTIFKWNSGTGTFLWNLLSFTKQLFAVYLWKAVSVVFLKFYFFLCEELEDNEDQRFNNNVNVTQFKKNTAKFHVMWKDILFAWSNSVWSFVQEKCL